MSARTHNFRIGLFVLIGAGLFIGALFAMGLRSYFGRSDVFETVVRGQVDNLTSGALVKLRGVTIGKVRSIEFAGVEYPEFKSRYVVIQFEVPRNFEWGVSADSLQQMLDDEAAKGLRARVQSQGFLGANFVGLEYVDPVLYPIEPIPFKPRRYYIPSAPNQFNRVLVSLEKTLRHVEDVDAGQLVDKAQKLIDAADRLVANINQIDFNQLGTNATGLIAEFRETNRRLQATLADARGAVGTARGHQQHRPAGAKPRHDRPGGEVLGRRDGNTAPVVQRGHRGVERGAGEWPQRHGRIDCSASSVVAATVRGDFQQAAQAGERDGGASPKQ